MVVSVFLYSLVTGETVVNTDTIVVGEVTIDVRPFFTLVDVMVFVEVRVTVTFLAFTLVAVFVKVEGETINEVTVIGLTIVLSFVRVDSLVKVVVVFLKRRRVEVRVWVKVSVKERVLVWCFTLVTVDKAVMVAVEVF